MLAVRIKGGHRFGHNGLSDGVEGQGDDVDRGWGGVGGWGEDGV